MDRFLAAGIDASKVHLAYNGFDPRLFDSAPTREQARQTLGLPTDARIVAYTGHVEARKGTDILLTIAALMPDVLVLVVGALPGSQGEREFRSEMQRQGVNNVRLVETVDPPAVPVYLAAMYVPPAQRFFELSPLGPGSWLIVLAYAGGCWALTLIADRLFS